MTDDALGTFSMPLIKGSDCFKSIYIVKGTAPLGGGRFSLAEERKVSSALSRLFTTLHLEEHEIWNINGLFGQSQTRKSL